MEKKTRFEVFKRDGFACQYCGKTPPAVTLEADHINPKSMGGNDDLNNLITACFDCNRGKRNIPLSKIPNTLSTNLEILKEQEKQLSEYNRFISKIDRRYLREVSEVSTVYMNKFKGWRPAESIQSSIKQFLKLLPKHEVIEAMQLACERKDKDQSLLYFCGICWHKIRGEEPQKNRKY